jgi:hypothetical protein
MNREVLFYDNHGEVGYDKQAGQYYCRIDDGTYNTFGYESLEDALADYKE